MVGGLQVARGFGQVRHLVVQPGDHAVLPDEVHLAVAVLEKRGVDVPGQRSARMDVRVRALGLAAGAPEQPAAAEVHRVGEPERLLEVVDFGRPEGPLVAVDLLLPGAFLDLPHQPERLPLPEIGRPPHANPIVGLPPGGKAGGAGEVVHPIAADADGWVAERIVEQGLQRRQRQPLRRHLGRVEHEPRVDVLSTIGLMAGRSQQVAAGAEDLPDRSRHVVALVVGDVRGGLEDLLAIEIHGHVLVVVHEERRHSKGPAVIVETRAEPDVGRAPWRADHGAGRARGAEPGRPLAPG